MPQESDPHPLIEALALLGRLFDEHHVAYAVMGGLAASFHGSQRATHDLDILIAVEKIRLPDFLKILSTNRKAECSGSQKTERGAT